MNNKKQNNLLLAGKCNFRWEQDEELLPTGKLYRPGERFPLPVDILLA